MLNAVTDYTILSDKSADHLTQKVDEHLTSGWVPSGPLVVKDSELLQAMVKFSNK